MNFTIAVESNADQVAALLEQFADRLPGALDAGVMAAGHATVEATKAAMDRDIYQQPLPASMVARGLVRTGALMAGEQLVLYDDAVMITTEPVEGPFAGKDPTEYSHWRHEYEGLPARWRDDGLRDVESQLAHVIEDAVIAELPAGVAT